MYLYMFYGYVTYPQELTVYSVCYVHVRVYLS